MPDLEALDRMIENPKAVNGTLSLDDIRVLPLLRSAAGGEGAKGLRFPQKVPAYFETMMSHIGAVTHDLRSTAMKRCAVFEPIDKRLHCALRDR